MNARIIKNKERLKNTKVAEQYTTTVIIIINNNNYVSSDDDCARTKTRQRDDHPKGRPKDLWRPKGRPRKVTSLCVACFRSCVSLLGLDTLKMTHH